MVEECGEAQQHLRVDGLLVEDAVHVYARAAIVACHLYDADAALLHHLLYFPSYVYCHKKKRGCSISVARSANLGSRIALTVETSNTQRPTLACIMEEAYAHAPYLYIVVAGAAINTCPGRRCCFALDCAGICEIQVCQETNLFRTLSSMFLLVLPPFGREHGAKLLLFVDSDKLFF